MQEKPGYHRGVTDDTWESLKAFTLARIAIGRTGVSVPMKEVLDFRLSNAFARDAVYSSMENSRLEKALNTFNLPVCSVRSKAADRPTYLKRPDYGRKLDNASVRLLVSENCTENGVIIIIADGLSALAVNRHALPVVERLLTKLKAMRLQVTYIVLAEQARVALGDEIGSLLKAKIVLMLVGERPGLTAPDSMGAYITYDPKPGTTDEARNCISNIWKGGLPYETAADKILHIIESACRLQLTGIRLKEEHGNGTTGFISQG